MALFSLQVAVFIILAAESEWLLVPTTWQKGCRSISCGALK